MPCKENNKQPRNSRFLDNTGAISGENLLHAFVTTRVADQLLEDLLYLYE